MLKLKSYIFPIALALPMAALLAACGGGGDDGDTSTGTQNPPQAVASVNVAAAWRNFLTGTWNWTATGIGPDGKKYTFSVATKPGAPGTFSLTGESGATSIQTSRVSVEGGNSATSTQTPYYSGANLFGIRYDDGTCSIVPRLPSAIPGASPIGSSGDFATSSEYATCTLPLQSPVSTTTNHWTIESDSGVTLFCITATTRNRAGQITEKEQDCLEAAADGTLGKRAKFTIYLSDTLSVVTRNF